MDKLRKVLREIEPFVIVVGSYARGEETQNSDIDLYIRRRSAKELEEDYLGELEEDYMPEIIRVLESNGVEWGSLVIGYVHTENLPLQLEFSGYFRIHKDTEVKKMNILGVYFASEKFRRMQRKV